MLPLCPCRPVYPPTPVDTPTPPLPPRPNPADPPQDSFDAATKEIGLWFDSAELAEYEVGQSDVSSPWLYLHS
jgi:hypothetical protein